MIGMGEILFLEGFWEEGGKGLGYDLHDLKRIIEEDVMSYLRRFLGRKYVLSNFCIDDFDSCGVLSSDLF